MNPFETSRFGAEAETAEEVDDRDDSSGDPLSPPGPASITVDGVSLSFGDLSVLEDVSLTVDPGEFVGFVGPNGAGKTTLLRIISGALEPDSGTVTVDGVDVHDVPSKRSSRLVSVVPQDTTLSFSFPVRDVVEMGRHPHRSRFSGPTPEDRAAVDRALERTRTADLADRPIDAVSGGQRQRVVLARAIAQATPVMLLDEPTASLDVNHQIETLESVRELVAEGRTVCAAIHDLDLAARYCDRLVVLADGDVLRDGPPSTVLTGETLSEAFDATAAVTPNPVTRSETVTALAREAVERSRLPDRVHVLGTGSAAAGVVARLETAGLEAAAADSETDAAGDAAEIDVSLGPVTSGDAAAETARSLGVDAIECEPFAGLSEAARDAVERRIRAADVVVLADLALADGTRPLLEAVAVADALVCVETRPIAERTAAGPAAREPYESCRDRAVESTVEGVLEAVIEANAIGERPASASVDSTDD